MYKLRELSQKDMEIVNQWRLDKEIISSLGAPYRFIDKEIDYIWYQNYLKNRDSNVRCAIIDDKDDLIMGLISLTSINYINRSAILHLMIGKENQGKGLGTFAVCEILDYAFKTLGLNRIELLVLEDNFRAIHLYEKNGFKKEGIKRQACFKDGKFKNMIVMSVLKEDI